MNGTTEKVTGKGIKNTGLYSRRSVLPCADHQDVNTIAKAVFGFASVTFEVRTHHHWGIRSRENA